MRLFPNSPPPVTEFSPPPSRFSARKVILNRSGNLASRYPSSTRERLSHRAPHDGCNHSNVAPGLHSLVARARAGTEREGGAWMMTHASTFRFPHEERVFRHRQATPPPTFVGIDRSAACRKICTRTHVRCGSRRLAATCTLGLTLAPRWPVALAAANRFPAHSAVFVQTLDNAQTHRSCVTKRGFARKKTRHLLRDVFPASKPTTETCIEPVSTRSREFPTVGVLSTFGEH